MDFGSANPFSSIAVLLAIPLDPNNERVKQMQIAQVTQVSPTLHVAKHG
jgi:hypothetical protein